MHELPRGRKAFDSIFVLAVKRPPDGGIDTFKARLVAKGFQERTNDDVYASVIDFKTIRLPLSVMVGKGTHTSVGCLDSFPEWIN